MLFMYLIAVLSVPNTVPSEHKDLSVEIAGMLNKYQLTSVCESFFFNRTVYARRVLFPFVCIELFPSCECSCKHDLLYHPENHSMLLTLKTKTICLFILFKVSTQNCHQHLPLHDSDYARTSVRVSACSGL